jgi:hypothetical protein
VSVFSDVLTSKLSDSKSMVDFRCSLSFILVLTPTPEDALNEAVTPSGRPELWLQNLVLALHRHAACNARDTNKRVSLLLSSFAYC